MILVVLMLRLEVIWLECTGNYFSGYLLLKTYHILKTFERDKCGAAFVAGFFKTLSLLKPKGLKAYGTLCMARNSIGEGINLVILM